MTKVEDRTIMSLLWLKLITLLEKQNLLNNEIGLN